MKVGGGVEYRLPRSGNAHLMKFNLPTALTWLRIILIPVFVGVYYLPASVLSMPAKNWLAMTVFALAAITDWADGYLARKWGQTSAFGAFLDPVADKLMIISALIVLVWLDRAAASLAIIIIGREIAISALREWMAQLGKAKGVAVAVIGKGKTVAQITAISALLLHQHRLARPDRALGRGYPDAVVDVSFPPARRAASFTDRIFTFVQRPVVVRWITAPHQCGTVGAVAPQRHTV